jgi:cell wall-associated NlpC family hydrolase
MNPFFTTPQKIQKLLDVLQSWKGTPFMDHVARKGVGADCVQFVLAVLIECGQMPKIEWPRYTIRHGGQKMADAWIEWVNKRSAGIEVSVDSLQAGDVILFSNLKIGNHVAIISQQPYFWHALIRYGVIENTLKDETYRRAVHKVWRPAEAAI